MRSLILRLRSRNTKLNAIRLARGIKVMTEAATVFWFPIEMLKPIPGATIWHGKDRKFESVENAVMFVMETLSVDDRRTAMIQTDQSSIHPPDIQAIYEGMKNKKG